MSDGYQTRMNAKSPALAAGEETGAGGLGDAS
jgi:hypothetical protein